MVDRINMNIKFNQNGETTPEIEDSAAIKQENSIFIQPQIQSVNSGQTNVLPNTASYNDEYEVMDDYEEYLVNSKNNTESELIRQMQAEIDKLKNELEAAIETRGMSGSITALFGGGTAKLQKQIQLKEMYLTNAINYPDKIDEAYKKIMGSELTDEIKNQTEQNLILNSQLTSEDKETMKQALLAEIENISGTMDNIKNDQGWFSKGLSGINNFFGFGTSEKESKAQIEAMKKQIAALDTDSDDFMAQYKVITGKDIADSIKTLNEGGSQLSNSKAAECIYDYQHTQSTLKEVGSGIVTGLAAAAAIIAAPLTGGGAIILGAVTGGAAKVGIEGTDTIGTSKKYSLEQGILDFAGGAIEGAVTGMTLGTARLAGKGMSVFKGAGKSAITKGTKVGLKQAFAGVGKSALNGTKIAAFSAASTYTVNTAGKTALYNATGNYTISDTPDNVVQNEDGTYTVYYKVTDSKTGNELCYEIEKLDSISKDAEGNIIKGEVLEKSRSNDFSIKDLGKQVAISAVSAAAGASIGRLTGGFINPNIAGATGSTALGNAAEIGADTILSLGADYAISDIRSVAETGEHVKAKDFFSWDRIIGEGRNQIRGLLIGLATTKANYNSAADSAIAGGLSDGKKDYGWGDDFDATVKLPDSIDTARTDAYTRVRTPDTDTDVKISGDDVKLDTDTKTVIERAGRMALDGDTEGAITYLREQGMQDGEIDSFVKEVEDVRQETKLDDNSDGTRVKRTDNDAEIKPDDEGSKVADSVKQLHKKIQTALGADTEADVESMISTIMKSGATRDEAITALQTLTQFGSIQSLQNAFKAAGLNDSLKGFEQIGKISANSALEYFCSKKHQIDIASWGYDKKKGFILDDAGLKYLENLKQENPSAFQNLIARDDLQFINLEGFNQGISIYSQGGSNKGALQNAADIITQARQIQATQGGTFEEAVKTAVNKGTLDRAASLGIDLANIKTVSGADQTADAGTILKNLAPLGVTDTKIEATAEEIAKTMFKDPTQAAQAKELIIKYLDAEADVYSPKRLGQQLAKMHDAIEHRVSSLKKANGESFTSDDIYYLIPSEGKSYEQILYQYALINNIPQDKFIYASAQDIQNLPDSKIYVAIDDVVGSGASMVSQGDGVKYSYSKNHGDRHIIMAPIASGETGATKIANAIKSKGRVGKDFLIIENSQVKQPLEKTDFYQNLSKSERVMLKQILEDVGHNASYGGYGLDGKSAYAIVFPYMAPDNDAALPSMFFDGLLLNPEAMKNKYNTSNAHVKVVLDRLKNAA